MLLHAAPPVALALFTLTFSGCGGHEHRSQYPARPEGCDVTVFAEAPNVPTSSIGVVNATCGADISNDDCLRTLKDETCKLGGDVVWGVADTPSLDSGRKRLNGRAAHTKQAR